MEPYMNDEIKDLTQKLLEIKGQLREAQQRTTHQEVKDFEFQTAQGPVRLSELFADKDSLILIHNMGASCSYCTLWADGLNGLNKHVCGRAAFVLCSPDSPENQVKLAQARGWSFRMVQDAAKEFTSEMGFYSDAEGWWPGSSAFVKKDGKLYRTGCTIFGPGDDFCAVWPLFDLLPNGADGWEPK